ncbi:MAG: excinuclease ABC subunit UvrA [Opitutales bacterium]
MNKSLNNAPTIRVKGAREHNLKDVTVEIPRNELVVITGVSGSGKSSLVFDTIYAEGYRKYIDSLSTKARNVLDQIPRPDVDFIQGLSPVIALEQRTGSGTNPRSTIATVTEIADYARVLWAACGVAYCPSDGGAIISRSLDQCIEKIYQEEEGSRLMLLAPWMQLKPSMLREELPRLAQKGFQRVRLNGDIYRLDDDDIIDSKSKLIQVDIVIDRVVLRDDQRSRIADSLELTFSEGSQQAIILVEQAGSDDWKEVKLSMELSCEHCGQIFPNPSAKMFSWNHPDGACENCGGTGETLQFRGELCVPDGSKSIKNGAIKPWRLGSKQMIIKRNAILKQLAEQLPYDPDCPWDDLDQDTQNHILHGVEDREFLFKLKGGNRKPESMPYHGVLADLEETRINTSSDGLRSRLLAYQTSKECADCKGERLNAISRNVLIEGVSLTDFLKMSLKEAKQFLKKLVKNKSYKSMSDAIDGLQSRVRFLDEVGLGYLNMNRAYSSLSGGESQRVRLATQLGMSLVGVVYILDEPSIGLHALDNRQLIQTIIGLRDRGNSVIVVEHDSEMMLAADHLIELGPEAGHAGGHITYEGKPKEAHKSKDSRSGAYLSGALQIEKNVKRNAVYSEYFKIIGAQENNLKSIDVSFPIGLISVVCGKSGSGKSTLINGILAKYAAFKLNRAKTIPGKHRSIEGLDAFSSVIQVNQDPIGRSPRSNPATFIKLFDLLRDLFSKCSLAKVRGYKSSRFSFNIKGGRCERCKGDGLIKLDMQFLSNVYSECPSCHGRRYNRETLDILFKGYSISDVLNMSVDEALKVFEKHPKIFQKLKTLSDVGLGYLKLGQSSTTLSGGEAQRIKLSLELSKKQQGDTLYILDEPTTGLHWVDIQKLMDLLFRLRDAGNSIIIIEHDKDVIRLADWIVELGPEGGEAGGELLFAGSPSEFFSSKTTPTQSIF